MQQFTIRDIENLTGIKAHTLRIWEQRYQLFIPKRKESLHRIYDNENLKQLLHISFLYDSGWKISKIASLSGSEIAQLVKEAKVGETSYAIFINQLIAAALDFNEYEFITVLNQVIEKTGFENCITKVCYPYLIKIGHLWTTNNVIPAQEHFTSYIIQNKIIVETDKLQTSHHTNPEIVLMCPQEEFHELPLLFINYLLKKNGWATLYAGCNKRLEQMDAIVRQPHIQYLYLHLITNLTGFEVDDYFEKICTKFPNKKIVASGEGAQKNQRGFANLIVLRSDKEIYNFIDRTH